MKPPKKLCKNCYHCEKWTCVNKPNVSYKYICRYYQDPTTAHGTCDEFLDRIEWNNRVEEFDISRQIE